jgi:hypothetical protein
VPQRAARIIRGLDRRDLRHILRGRDLPAVERPDIVPQRAARIIRGLDRRDLRHILRGGDLPAERAPSELPTRPDRIIRKHYGCHVGDGMSDRHDNGSDRFDEHRRLPRIVAD